VSILSDSIENPKLNDYCSVIATKRIVTIELAEIFIGS